MKVSLKDLIQLLVFTSIGAFILWHLWQSQEAAYMKDCKILKIPDTECSLWTKLKTDFQSCNYVWVLVVCIIYMLGNVFRALRWNQMLAPLGMKPKFHNTFFVIMVGYFANLGVPRSGEFIRAGLFSKYEKKPFDKVFGTIIMDRILDVFSLLIMLSLGFFLSFDVLWNYVSEQLPAQSDKLVLYGAIALGLGIVGILTLYFLFTSSNIKRPLVLKLKKTLSGLWNGLKSVKDVQNIPLFIAYSIGIWLSYYLMNYLMFFAFGPTEHLGALEGLLVFDFGALGIVFPSPGGMGTYHAMIMESLSIVGINKIDGFSFAMILFFSINLFCNIVFGLLGLIALPLLNSKRENN